MNSFYVLCVILLAADFFVHRHELKLADGNLIKTLEQMPSFYAVYGFVGCSLLVFGAKLMRIFLMRDEAYYDQRSDEAFYANTNQNEHNEHIETEATHKSGDDNIQHTSGEHK